MILDEELKGFVFYLVKISILDFVDLIRIWGECLVKIVCK